MNYTHGPWKVISGAVYRDSDNAPIARMVRDETADEAGITPTERDMNAYLVAAAPDLLVALQAIEWVIDIDTGEYYCPECGHYRKGGYYREEGKHSDSCILATALTAATRH